MFCPNYKIKEVKDGFNEIIKALGGQPLTDEEFRSSELRNKRTGVNYSAMESAYKLYHRNGGNMLDLAPNGKRSVLFNTLLEHFGGNREAAIVAKSHVYSDEFMNWFGQWIGPALGIQDEDINFEEISKVIDENGEPLVVWHGGVNNIEQFKLPDNFAEIDFTTFQNIEWAKKEGYNISSEQEDFYNSHGYIKGFVYKPTGIYFAKDQVVSRSYFGRRNEEDTGLYPVYLNIKNPNITNKNGKQMHDDSSTVEDLQTAINNNQDGVIIEDVRDFGPNDEERMNWDTGEFAVNATTDYIIFNPNQVKHVENLGTFDPNNPNIYHVSAEPKTAEYKVQQVSFDTFFDTNTLNDLQSDKLVSSSNIIQHLLDTESFSNYNLDLAQILVKHNIPVIFNSLPKGKPMDAVEYSDGTIIIEIDPEQLTLYSQEDAAEFFLHEVVHGVSIKALRNPETSEEKDFNTATFKVYDIFDKLLPESEYSRSSMDTGAYILSDVYEFAAVFATDENSKYLLYTKAKEADLAGNNKVWLRLKRFVNALARLLVNKNVFKGINQDELAIYEKNINKFLKTRKVDTKNISIIDEFNKNLDLLTADVLNRKQTRLLHERLLRNESNFIRHFVQASTEPYNATNHKLLWEARVRITEALQTRLAAINTSTIADDVKYNAKQVVETQIQQFQNSSVSTVVALSSFIHQTVPQLLDDVDTIRNMDESDHSFYMYHMHDNFGAYAAIFSQLDIDLKDKRLLTELGEEFENIEELDKLSAVKSTKDLLSIVGDAAAAARDGVSYMFNILMNNMRRDLQKVGEEVNFASTKQMLDSLSTIGFDSNTFINMLGSKDGSKDPVIRTIVYLVNKAIRKSKEQTARVANDMIQLADKLRPGESTLDLYELDDNGRTTQYLVRELNFGKFYNAYRDFLEEQNKKYELPVGNRKAPEDAAKRKQWNIEKNEWLARHAERRFKPEYYQAYAELSDDTLQQLNTVRNAISQLKKLAYDESDGYYHYEKLTPQEWLRLQGLYIEKRLLGSDYTLYGDLKIEGTDQWRMAKEIQALNEKLYSDTTQIRRATDAWQRARNKVIQDNIRKYTGEGGIVNMNAVNAAVNKWDERNSKRMFKKDEDKLAVFKLIEEMTERQLGFKKPVYEKDGDGGATYEANAKRINELIGIFRDYNTGEPNLTIMPARVRSNIKQLEIENSKIKKAAKNADTVLKKQSKAWDKAYRKNFTKYLRSTYTSYYRKKMSETLGGAAEVDVVSRRIPKWASKLVVKPGQDEQGVSYIEKFTELVPGDGWINSDENNSLLNPNYDSSMNVPFIPKKKVTLEDGRVITPYDNSVQYNRIMNSPTLKALYDKTVEYISEANDKYYTRLYQDNYLLPGITGSMWKYMKAHGTSGSVSAAWQYTKDHMGLTEQGLRQDIEFGSTLENALATVTELDEYITQNTPFAGKQTGVRPDGRQFNIIPQYYTRKLDDTSQLSSDLVGMVCEYYENACNFENKSEVKDFVESLVDVIENRRYEIVNSKTGNREVIKGSSSKAFKAAKDFVQMNMYNIRSSQQQVGPVNMGKVAQNFSRLTQALNLGMSPAVALTGFFTAQYAHLINALVGDRGYGMNEWTQATGEVIHHYIMNYGGIGYASNNKSTDKIMLLAEEFDVANQLKRKFKNVNRSRIIRFLDNWCFGGLTTVDFASKTTIMTTILMSHRFMDGRFVTREDVLNMLAASSKEGRKSLLERWQQGKTLYSVFNVVDGQLHIDEEYKSAYDASKNMIYHRINKTAESADGMATETQKAAITTNFFGAAVLTHRQYLPLMIQQRFLPQVWDFDMQMFIQGQYIVDWQFFKNVVWGTIKDGFKIETFRQLYDQFTHDTSSEEAWKLSRARQKALKKTAIELAVFNAVVVPLVSLICMFADDDDNKDKLALQLAAYIARRTQWETFTPYRFDDMLNNIKSVSAQTGTLDKFDALRNTFERRLFPQGSLLDGVLGLSSKKPLSELIERGVYQGHTRTYRTLMQLTPYHNLYEQWYGSKQKRAYYEKQIMKIEK